MTSIRSSGPSPRSASMASATSRALPTARPSGVSIRVTSARVRTPCSSPSATMVRARSSARSGSRMKAPDPVLTSSTRALVPSAIFLDMIELAISGIDSTVPVTSRSAYSLRSAGAGLAGRRDDRADLVSAAVSSSLPRLARQPGIDSSLSRVPPVCPRPRPDSIGTTAPQLATSGASTSETLSPTPPVECLSTDGRGLPPAPTGGAGQVQPLARGDHLPGPGPELGPVEPVEVDRHQQRRHLLVGHLAAGVGGEQPADLRSVNGRVLSRLRWISDTTSGISALPTGDRL